MGFYLINHFISLIGIYNGINIAKWLGELIGQCKTTV